MAASLSSRTQSLYKCKSPLPPPSSSQFIKHSNLIPRNSSTKAADNGLNLKNSKSKPSFSSKTKRSRIMARLINSRPWSSDLEASLSAAAAFTPQSSLSQTAVLHTLRLIQLPSKALHFFHWAYRSGFSHTPQSYLLMLEILCRARNFHSARNFLFSIPQKSNGAVKLEDKHFNTLIRAFGEAGLFKESLNIFQTMKSIGVSPSVVTFNNLFLILFKRSRTGKVFELYDEMLKTYGVTPDLYSFNILIRGFCKNSMVDEAFRIFKEMENLSEKGEFDKAEKLFQELFEKEILLRDDGSTPLVASYNSMFIYLSETGKTEMADRVLRQLLKRGKQDASAFKTLIMGHCREGAFKAAFDLMVVMLRRDFLPDVESFEFVIDGLLQMDEAVLAHKTLEMMLKSSHLPRTSTFHRILAELVRKGYVGESYSLVNLMLEKKIRQNANIATDTVKMLYEGGLKDKAFGIISCLYENGYLVNFEEIITFLCQQKKLLEAQKLLLFGTKSGQRFDIGVYDVLLIGLCKSQRVVEAFELYYELLEQGIQQPLTCLEDLKAALEAEGKLKEAQFVSKRMPNKFQLNKSVATSRVTKRGPDL
ncbi:OLC1v1027058C1 [Oldenlandia corymbosa var. corymbosa]|uniref:OLC1v1027058C1 n=1 Tax=Oldenlandia corymbosa var. corymbosa TaxID=529605 RepID=A0AAV1CBU1_OLDCO|nr:OLC1v1027058C1 [Oldenlandia corymbosa var. corymbosa]